MINSHVISSGKVEGSSVYNSKGDKLGSINDLMIDKYSGHVRYAVLVDLPRFHGRFKGS